MAKWGNVDDSELIKLRDRFEKMTKPEMQQAFYEECLKEVAARMLRKVIQRTPVSQTLRIDIAITDNDGNKVKYKKGKNTGQVKTKSMVIHTGGTLRRGWTARTHEEAESGKGSGKSIDEYLKNANVTKVGNSYQIVISNHVKYASYVNYGHRQTPGRYVKVLGKRLKKSWVQGNFMLEISEAEIERILPPMIEKKLNEYIKRCFNGN